MPIEEHRFIYLGIGKTYTNIYLGNASAKFAKFLYNKAGMNINIQKTDILANINEFSYLIHISGSKFKNNNNIKDDILTLLDSYRIICDNQFKCFNNTYNFSYDVFYKDKNLIMANFDDKTSVVVDKNEMSDYKDSIVALKDWNIVTSYNTNDKYYKNIKTET